MDSIRVDIEELLDKLNSMLEDNYVTVNLKIKDDGYTKELEIDAVTLDDEENASYGTLAEIEDEI